MNLPLIPSPWMAAARRVPAWVYLGAAASVLALSALAWASHKGAEKQRQVDAPIVAQVPVAQGSATLTYKVQEDTSARHVKENAIQAQAQRHEARVSAPSGDGGYGALNEWLCDTDGVQPGCPAKGR